MADLTVSANIDTLLQASNFAAARDSLGVPDQIAASEANHVFVSGGATREQVETPVEIDPSTGDMTGVGDVTADSLAVTNAIQLGENAPILLDAALSADGKYSGICEAGTAGATLAFGQTVYFQASDSRWELTAADDAATSGPLKAGICVLAAAADGDPTRILLFGKIRADAQFPTLTIGAPVYFGTSAGEVQVAQPSGTDEVIRIAGHAVTADVLMFNPSPDYITHT